MLECFFAPAHAGHDPAHEWMDGRLAPYLETPARAAIILAALRDAGHAPQPVAAALSTADAALVAAVHDADYLAYLESAYGEWVAATGDPAGVSPSTFVPRELGRRPASPLALAGWYGFDCSGVLVAASWPAILGAAACALRAVAALDDRAATAYALCRPPGHHAYAGRFGGYCFVNNAAVAAAALRRRHARVAIIDIDYHHGNGTAAIFDARADVLYVSLHGDPAQAYPYFAGFRSEEGHGAGRGYTRNYPLPPGTGDALYLATLEDACRTVEQFRPGALVISAGFDTYHADPLGDFALTTACFAQIGARLRALALPTVVVQEGGYAVAALGQNAVALLGGLAG